MRLGFGLPAAGPWATPENFARVARQAEALGYHSLWVFQRLLYPVRPQDEYYGAPGGAWPEAFRSVLDPAATLAYVAALTQTIRLGVSVLIMPFYAPVVLAKQLTTLDVLSGGRLDVGLGLGWSRDERITLRTLTIPGVATTVEERWSVHGCRGPQRRASLLQ